MAAGARIVTRPTTSPRRGYSPIHLATTLGNNCNRRLSAPPLNTETNENNDVQLMSILHMPKRCVHNGRVDIRIPVDCAYMCTFYTCITLLIQHI